MLFAGLSLLEGYSSFPLIIVTRSDFGGSVCNSVVDVEVCLWSTFRSLSKRVTIKSSAFMMYRSMEMTFLTFVFFCFFFFPEGGRGLLRLEKICCCFSMF